MPIDTPMMAEHLLGRVVSVNVGEPRQVRWQERTVTTAIWKQPVDVRVRAEGVNIAGDDQADRRVHGGATKAIYAYSVEDYQCGAPNSVGRPGGVVTALTSCYPGSAGGTEAVRLEDGTGRVSAPFLWARVGLDGLARVAARAGLQVTDHWDSQGRTFAAMSARFASRA